MNPPYTWSCVFVVVAKSERRRITPPQRKSNSQLHLQLSLQILPLKLGILPHVGGDHPLDLLLLQQQPQSEGVHPGIVAHHSQVVHLRLQQPSNQVFRNPTQTKPSNEQLGTILDISNSFVSTLEKVRSKAWVGGGQSSCIGDGCIA